LIKELPHSKSRACRVLATSRSSLIYKSIKNDEYIHNKLNELVLANPREGFWSYYYRLRNRNDKINHKRLHRVYKEMKLPLRRKVKKRLPARVKERLEVPSCFTHTWSIDFTSDALSTTRKFRSFNVIDDFNREVLFIETDYSLKSSRVIWVLNHLINKFGKPAKIRMDNGPEFIANIARDWSEVKGIEFKYIEPGKPTQNAYIERFNRTYRNIVLDSYIFDTLDEVREVTANFIHDYNNERPHKSLGGISPINYRNMKQENLNIFVEEKQKHGMKAVV
jgi:putative transposase